MKIQTICHSECSEKYENIKSCSIGFAIQWVLLFFLFSCQNEEPTAIGKPINVSLTIALGGVHGYSSGLPEDLATETRASTPMTTDTQFRVVALQNNRIVAHADYTVTTSGVSVVSNVMQLLPGKYKFVAYSFNTASTLPILNDEGTVSVTDATDLLFAQDIEEFREVRTDPVSLSFTFVPQRARVCVNMKTFDSDKSITSPGVVTLSGSFRSKAAFSIAGGMLFDYVDNVATTYPLSFTDVASSVRSSNWIYVLPTSGISTLNISNALVMEHISFSGSRELPRLLPGKEYVHIQVLFSQNQLLNGANSFIVSNAGTYVIDASIKGNGKQITLPTNFDSSTIAEAVPVNISEVNITGARSAKVLWETINTTVAPTLGYIVSDLDYDPNSKLIKFVTGSTEGNAVIALYDGPDGTGNVLWSWHIWRTNSIPNGYSLAAIEKFTNLSGQFIMMDRNLGALSAEPQSDLSAGLLYQWGRKDPFTGPATLSRGTASMAVSGQKMIIHQGSSSVTPEMGVANPGTYYTGYSPDFGWCSRNDNLWGTPITYTVTSGYKYNRNKGSKTIYDPCPSGWHVPPSYIFINAAASYSSYDRGYTFLKMCSTGEPLWFPAAAGRDAFNGLLSFVEANGFYWTASPSGDSTINGCYLIFYDDGMGTGDSSYRSNAYPIRCVHSEERPVYLCGF